MATYRYLQTGPDRPADEVLETAYGLAELQHRAVVRDTLRGEYRVFPSWEAFWLWRAALPEGPRCFDEVVFAPHPQRLKFDIDIAAARLDPLNAEALGAAPREAAGRQRPTADDVGAPRDAEIESYISELLGNEPLAETDTCANAADGQAAKADAVVGALLAAILEELGEVYGATDGVAPGDSDLVVAESSGPTDGGGWKYSFHILTMAYAVATNEEAKAFTARVLDALPEAVRPFVDQVNKKVQNFRLAGSTKPGSSRVKRVTARFGTCDAPLEETTVAPRPGTRLLTRRIGADAAGAGVPDLELGGEDIVRITGALAKSRTVEGHQFRGARGTRLSYNRLRPTHCHICDEIHHHDHTLVIDIEPAASAASQQGGPSGTALADVGSAPHKLIERCRHAPQKSQVVATIDLALTNPAGLAMKRPARQPGGSADAGAESQERWLEAFIAGIQQDEAAEHPAAAPALAPAPAPVPALAPEPRGRPAPSPTGPLSTRFEALPSRNEYSEPRMRPYELVPTLAVKAQMKMGKTRELKAYLARHFPPGGVRERVIRFVTFRKTFSQSIQRDHFTDFELYSDHSGDLSPTQYPRLIIQVESLHRIPMGAAPEPVDLLVLDEFESILAQFDSGLHRNFTAAFAMFEWMLRTAAHVVCMDANLGDRALRALELFRGERPPLYHWNRHQAAAGDTYRVTSDQTLWLDNLYRALQEGKRLVVPTNSLCEAETLTAEIRRRCPGKAVRLYSSRTTPSEKERHFADVHRYWAGLDVLIYTPTVSAGVSFELAHFDALYGYFTDASCDVETCRQMIGRVRQLADREHFLCLVGRRGNLPTDTGDIRRLLRDKRTNLYRTISDVGLAFTYGPAGEVVYHESPYFHLWLETVRMTNLSRNNFAERFVAQVAATGARVEKLASPGPEAQDRLLGIRAAQSGARREIRAEECRAVANAPDLRPDEVQDVRARFERQADVPPALLRGHQKYLLRETYDWHGRPLDAAFVASYGPKNVRAVFRNLRRITVGETVVESLQLIQEREMAHNRGLMEARLPANAGAPPRPMAAEGASALESRDLHHRYVYQAHFLAVWLLHLCGFRCVTDRAYLREETVYHAMRAGEAEFLERLDAIAFEFEVRRPSVRGVVGEPDRPIYVARVLGVVNRVIGKMYGVAVRRTRKSEGGKDFRISPGKVARLFDFSAGPGGPKPSIVSRLRPVAADVADNFLVEIFYDEYAPLTAGADAGSFQELLGAPEEQPPSDEDVCPYAEAEAAARPEQLLCSKLPDDEDADGGAEAYFERLLRGE